MQNIHDPSSLNNPNYVKVAVDLNNFALLFSRSVIPYNRAQITPLQYYEHIGIYGFRKDSLLRYSKALPTPLELAEKIECLRFLEMGIKIKMAITEYMGIEIDTPDDLLKAQEFLKQNKIKNKN